MTPQSRPFLGRMSVISAAKRQDDIQKFQGNQAYIARASQRTNYVLCLVWSESRACFMCRAGYSKTGYVAQVSLELMATLLLLPQTSFHKY